jgi:hypothetical protein
MNKHFVTIPLSFGCTVTIPIEDIKQIYQNNIGDVYIKTDDEKYCMNNDETLEQLIDRINKILKYDFDRNQNCSI